MSQFGEAHFLNPELVYQFVFVGKTAEVCWVNQHYAL